MLLAMRAVNADHFVLDGDRREAQDWLDKTHGALDGIVAKHCDELYVPDKRSMLKVKVKHFRSADCVIGGFRYAHGTRQVGYLLLGLYDADGKLNHIGFTSAISTADRHALTKRLERLQGGTGFTGDAPGRPSRWSNERWVPVRSELVVEVSYDRVTGGRFRHAHHASALAPGQGAAPVYRGPITRRDPAWPTGRGNPVTASASLRPCSTLSVVADFAHNSVRCTCADTSLAVCPAEER
jgi:ATP-dependent DNA ligase